MTKHKKSGNHYADVTINDYANSSVLNTRNRKVTSNVNLTQVLNDFADDKSWEALPDDFETKLVEKENEDGTISIVVEKTRRRKKNTSVSDPSSDTGRSYPIDIWFLIAKYIRPEDVGRFAGICKSSNAATKTASFWLTLYRRFYKNGVNLPERLRPECLLYRKYGVRTAVIRALHFMYEPFVSRQRSLEKSDQHPDNLAKRQCVLVWSQQVKENYTYYFKLKRSGVNQPWGRNRSSGFNLLEMLDDIEANREADCRILQVSCSKLIPIAPVMGLTLVAAQLNLSAELRSHKLQLWFGSGIYTSMPSLDGNGKTLVILEPVMNVKILDWWHPLYPYNYDMEYPVNQD